MKHNFANWEITQLLPEKNPYSDFDYRGVWKSKKEIAPSKYYSNLGGDYEYDDGIRDAWSWEDIRLYLLSKGYIIDIIYVMDREGEQLQWYFKVLTISTYETDEDFTYYSTYEECREAAILFILNENGWNR